MPEDHHYNQEDFLELLRKVKEARENSNKVTGLLSTERTLWNTEHQELLKAVQEADNKVVEAEHALRVMLLEDYEFTGRTKYNGVQIKVFETIRYDQAKAIEWAKVNMAAAVRTVLDIKVFEAFAKASPIPGLVEVVKTAKVMIPTKIELKDGE